MSGYSTGLVAYVLSNWRDFCETGRLPRRSWELGIRSGQRIYGGASFEYPATLRVDVQRALDSLDEETRQVVHLRYLSGLPRYKVANRLGVRTVWSLEPLVEAAVGKVTTILNGGSNGMATNIPERSVEEQRGEDLERLYDALDHRLKDLPPGWRGVQVKREGHKFAVQVVY